MFDEESSPLQCTAARQKGSKLKIKKPCLRVSIFLFGPEKIMYQSEANGGGLGRWDLLKSQHIYADFF